MLDNNSVVLAIAFIALARVNGTDENISLFVVYLIFDGLINETAG